jgi:hypothetical protein
LFKGVYDDYRQARKNIAARNESNGDGGVRSRT